MNELKRLLEEGCNSDPRHASQLRNAVQLYIVEVEKKEAEAKRKESEFKAREEKYLAEIVALTNKNLEQDKFFSIIAHDLRGPLGNFKEFVKILINDGKTMSDEELHNFYVMLGDASGGIYKLLEDLLEWSKAKTGKTSLNLQNTYLGAIMLRVRMLTAGSAEIKGIKIEERISIDSELKCDFFVIETIMRNLIMNAIKFSKAGNKITVSSKIIKENVEISISDNGIGMSKEMVGKMFQLNSDVKRPGTAGEKSHGLGLHLCKELIELHGGEIWVESEEGIGSTFHFTIPLNFNSSQSVRE